MRIFVNNLNIRTTLYLYNIPQSLIRKSVSLFYYQYTSNITKNILAFGFPGEMIDHWPLRFESVKLEKLFLFVIETNGSDFESAVVFFKNSNVELKCIF